MKKALVIALFVGFSAINFSCSKEASAQSKTIETFVATYFPEAEILSTIRDGLDYEVTLSDYTQIDFDGNLLGNLEWDEVDCKHSSIYKVVPSALVPTEITNYVSRLHPTQSIVKISKDGLGWDIELSNGIEIEFDKRFNVVDFDA